MIQTRLKVELISDSSLDKSLKLYVSSETTIVQINKPKPYILMSHFPLGKVFKFCARRTTNIQTHRHLHRQDD